MVGAAAREPTAVLVVSVWREGLPPRLAARITYTLDVAQSERVTVTAAGVDEIAEVVLGWLHEVEAAQQQAGDAPVTEE
jgi:hypothetical protein